MSWINEANATKAFTVTALSAGTIASVVLTANAATTAATVSFLGLSVLGAATSSAAIMAAFDPKSTDSKSFFQNTGEYCVVTIPTYTKVVAETAVMGAVEAATSAFGAKIEKKLS